jgi:hypothetical protein
MLDLLERVLVLGLNIEELHILLPLFEETLEVVILSLDRLLVMFLDQGLLPFLARYHHVLVLLSNHPGTKPRYQKKPFHLHKTNT